METAERVRLSKPAGNTDTGILKVIALVFMMIDHLGVLIFPGVQELRVLGRTAFPIYAWCAVVGICYTRNPWKYLLRVLAAGVLIQPLYSFTMLHGWSDNRLSSLAEQWTAMAEENPGMPDLLIALFAKLFTKPSIFFTLTLGIGSLMGLRSRYRLLQILVPIAALIAANLIGSDYGWKGVLLIILLYAARDSRPAIAAVMVSFFMYWGTEYYLMSGLFGIRFDFAGLPRAVNLLVTPFFRLETFALLSLPFILIRFKTGYKMPKWLSYGLYPAHLVLLLLIRQFM